MIKKMFIVNFKGHEFSPLIYNYDERRGTIDFIEKLDQQEATTGKQTIKFVFEIYLFKFCYYCCLST